MATKQSPFNRHCGKLS